MNPLVRRSLDNCKGDALKIEAAADMLGRDWPGWAPLLELCSNFRRQCQELVEGRGLGMETIAFIGPRKAGKSSLLKLLIRDPAVRDQIKAGTAFATSTEKLIWIGPKQPVGMDPSVEEYLPCSNAGMPLFGVACTLADVPGENEIDSARAQASERALDLALVKVIVIRFSDRTNASVMALARRAGRSILLPVITMLRPTDTRAELATLKNEIARLAPDATILEPLIADEFDHPQTDEDYPAHFAAELSARLADAILKHPAAPLTSELLEGHRKRFITQSRELAQLHLRASAGAAASLHNAVTDALNEAAANLLGNDRELLPGIRWSLRMNLLERTPGWCFPWRPLLSVASLASGVLDRLPSALLGSLPSLGAVIFQGFQNVRSGAAFQESARTGLRNHFSQRLRELLAQKFASLDDALRHDFGSNLNVATTGDGAQLEPIGLDELQTRSSALIHESVELYSPGRLSSFVTALSGFVVFWGIFGWPLMSVYQDFSRAAIVLWKGAAVATGLFPHDTGSTLFTALFLAMLPMFILLLVILSWFIRRSVVEACLGELRARHTQLCTEMISKNIVSVRVSEPRLNACLTLLTPQN